MIVTRREFIRSGSILAASLAGVGFSSGGADRREADVCIYGATSGGLLAAIALAKLGRSVIVIEPTRHVGGMTTGGLSYVDHGRIETIGGLTKAYFDEARAHYTTGGKTEGNGWSVEPHVAEGIFDRWIQAHRIEVIREARRI